MKLLLDVLTGYVVVFNLINYYLLMAGFAAAYRDSTNILRAGAGQPKIRWSPPLVKLYVAANWVSVAWFVLVMTTSLAPTPTTAVVLVGEPALLVLSSTRLALLIKSKRFEKELIGKGFMSQLEWTYNNLRPNVIQGIVRVGYPLALAAAYFL